MPRASSDPAGHAELLSASEAGTAGPSTFASRRAARLARQAAGVVELRGRSGLLRVGDDAENTFTIREVSG